MPFRLAIRAHKSRQMGRPGLQPAKNCLQSPNSDRRERELKKRPLEKKSSNGLEIEDILSTTFARLRAGIKARINEYIRRIWELIAIRVRVGWVWDRAVDGSRPPVI